MEHATIIDVDELLSFYSSVIEAVNKSSVKLGWNINIYPNIDFIKSSITVGELFVIRRDFKIVAAAVVNHKMNDEYDLIEWEVKGPKDKLVTIHALATLPEYRGGSVSDSFLSDIRDYCRTNGDKAIHLDVIDTNYPAYKLYLRNGYKEVDNIKMFYEVVGTREFWMLEYVL